MDTELDKVVLSCDGDEVSLIDFIKLNVIDDVGITLEDLSAVLRLQVLPDEFVYVDRMEVRRIK